jgi:hypothetical protein
MTTDITQNTGSRYLVAAWLAGIIVNPLLLSDYGDVALRDLGLLVAALALARIAVTHAPARSWSRSGGDTR